MKAHILGPTAILLLATGFACPDAPTLPATDVDSGPAYDTGWKVTFVMLNWPEDTLTVLVNDMYIDQVRETMADGGTGLVFGRVQADAHFDDRYPWHLYPWPEVGRAGAAFGNSGGVGRIYSFQRPMRTEEEVRYLMEEDSGWWAGRAYPLSVSDTLVTVGRIPADWHDQ